MDELLNLDVDWTTAGAGSVMALLTVWALRLVKWAITPTPPTAFQTELFTRLTQALRIDRCTLKGAWVEVDDGAGGRLYCSSDSGTIWLYDDNNTLAEKVEQELTWRQRLEFFRREHRIRRLLMAKEDEPEVKKDGVTSRPLWKQKPGGVS